MAKRSRAASVRDAVDRTVQATMGQANVTRERAQELVDELAATAGRVREALDDLRVASGDDIRAVRAEIRALERRIAALEKTVAAKPKKAAAKPRKAQK